MKNLIVNADDLAWTEGVNRGILDAHRNGIVTSTSLLANGTAFESALAAAKSAPNLGIGVPETLLLKIATSSINPHEVEDEWSAQIEKIREAGIQPTHLDGHKHVHM